MDEYSAFDNSNIFFTLGALPWDPVLTLVEEPLFDRPKYGILLFPKEFSLSGKGFPWLIPLANFSSLNEIKK
jgi:hypothetical protein